MVGPNLTDNYWLHGGSLQDVFKSIKYGWKDKGMPEWQHNMSAKQIAGLASYIKSLSGKNVPGGKEPQGDLFVEGGGSGADTAGKAETPKLSMNQGSSHMKG
jgi:cytochrome c oxidase cbb3-type subunit 3